ncbi:NADH dehydrogenase ubiquinone 1 alpha subcomplex assembly factor 3 [Porphyridium purpureum]|uniref:NADH dehydrogenase ubiquinone 1 alpha subcomplex assembly factor 3 n=1 Tax=Porphyridium purpureum TaxID=35688 RepID=A0A5J4YZ94_PORPP|nr:NADH dehydrogenase ubiquinone 1 alpha subcomplex assembly factor 3 [Porphyridium purpureum]|eukprot:POR0619..scf208_2
MRASTRRLCSAGLGVIRARTGGAVTHTASRERVIIEKYGRNSFEISGVDLRGAVLVFPSFALLWNVRTAAEIVPGAFVALTTLNPRPDLLLLGLGDQGTAALPRQALHALQLTGIPFEVSDTPSSLNTFNVLNAESRLVCAALLPVQTL